MRKKTPIQTLNRRIRLALYLHQQSEELERDYLDTPERSLALALIDGIADAMEQSLLDAAYTPAEMVIEHKPETTTKKHEEPVSTKQQQTSDQEPAIDMNQLADQLFETA
jgi:hypothetical protein